MCGLVVGLVVAALNESIFSGLGRTVDWVFLEVHAEGECGRLCSRAERGGVLAVTVWPRSRSPLDW